MTKSLVACSPAADRHVFHDQLSRANRDRAARSRRRRERAETRLQALQAEGERAEATLQTAARVVAARVMAKWADNEIGFWNEDRASWELGQALRAAGFGRPIRDRIKAALIGPKCPSCLSRLCRLTAEDCERRLWEAELADYEYDFSRTKSYRGS